MGAGMRYITMLRKAALLLAVLVYGNAYAQQQSVNTQPVWYSQGRLSSPVDVTTSSAATALPAGGFAVLLCNTGSADAYVAFGTTNAVTATTAASSWLKAGACAAYNRSPVTGTVYQYVAAITASGSTSLYVESGAGSPPGLYGGTSSSGGGNTTVDQGTSPWVIDGDVNISGVNGATPSASNPIWVAPASSTAFPVLSAPRSTLTTAGCTVGTSSAECIAASTANFWVQVQNTHVTNTIACSWGGTASLNSTGSFMLEPGQSASWGVTTSGIPTNALNCIASGASTPLYIEMR